MGCHDLVETCRCSEVTGTTCLNVLFLIFFGMIRRQRRNLKVFKKTLAKRALGSYTIPPNDRVTGENEGIPRINLTMKLEMHKGRSSQDVHGPGSPHLHRQS